MTIDHPGPRDPLFSQSWGEGLKVQTRRLLRDQLCRIPGISEVTLTGSHPHCREGIPMALGQNRNE